MTEEISEKQYHMRFAILIDFDNLSASQKSSVIDITTKTLFLLPKKFFTTRGECIVRLYGGWYEENNMTVRAQELSVLVQKEFPTIIRVPTDTGSSLALSTSAELAATLAEEPSHILFNTFRRKGKPTNIRILKPEEADCTNGSCSLIALKKLISTGRCASVDCEIQRKDMIYRSEQKLVDTMLTCDLLYYSELKYDHIILVSDDDDFLPPLRTAALHGTRIYRVHPTHSNERSAIHIAGNQLIELEL